MAWSLDIEITTTTVPVHLDLLTLAESQTGEHLVFQDIRCFFKALVEHHIKEVWCWDLTFVSGFLLDACRGQVHFEIDRNFHTGKVYRLKFGKVTFKDLKLQYPFHMHDIKKWEGDWTDWSRLEVMSGILRRFQPQKITIASEAFSHFKKSLKGGPYNFLMKYDELQDLGLKAYYGGFLYLDEQIYHDHDPIGHGYSLDINSLYPYVMLHTDWWPDVHRSRPLTAQELPDALLHERFFIVTIKLIDLQLKKGAFPTKVWAVDQWNDFYTITSYDLRWLIYSYHINYQFVSGTIFKSGYKNIFSAWGTALQAQKEHATTRLMTKYYKRQLNSVAGKLSHRKTFLGSAPLAFIGGMQRFQKKNEESRSVGNTVAGAFLTAKARAYLWQWCYTLHRHHYKIFYCDTDSIHLLTDHIASAKKLLPMHPKKFGCFKVESEWRRAMYLGYKVYGHDEKDGLKLTVAGLPSAAKKVLEARDYDLAIDDLESALMTIPIKQWTRVAGGFQASTIYWGNSLFDIERKATMEQHFR